MSLSDERLAKNEILFRRINERLDEIRVDRPDGGRVKAFCSVCGSGRRS